MRARRNLSTKVQQTLVPLIFGIVVNTSCGRGRDAPTSDLLIVGGTVVDANSPIAKSTVALVDMTSSRAFCTGSLVGLRKVLTAAHCLEGITASQIRVGVAFGLTAQRSTVIPAETLTMHPDYSPDLMSSATPLGAPHDIAVVTLQAPAPASHTPITVMELDQPIRVGEALVLAGYGLTSVTGIDRSGTLRRVTTAITALSSTRKEIEFGNNPGRSACMGDSGGPAFVIRAGILRLVGVTSRGSPQCDQDGIYTDARYFKPFIDAAI